MCAFTTKCECTKIVKYTDHMIRDVLLHGISDMDIRREVLGVSDILETAVNEVICIVEGKEMACNALLSANISRISSIKQQPDSRAVTSSSEQATCLDCKNLYKIFTQGPRGSNKKPHKVCINCYRAGWRRDWKQQHRSTPTPAVQSLASDPVLQVGAIEVNEPQLQGKCNSTPCSINTIVKQPPIILGHQVFTKVNGNEHNNKNTQELQLPSQLTPMNKPRKMDQLMHSTSMRRSQQSWTLVHNLTYGRFQTSWHTGSHTMIYCLLIWVCQQPTDHLSLLKGHFSINLQQSLIMAKRNHAAP